MKNLQPLPPQVSELFSLEWKRAKRILTPFLDRKKIPKTYGSNLMKGRWGVHIGSDRTYSMRVGKRWVRNSHTIVLNTNRSLEEMVHTVRHEICHVVEQNHGARFKMLLKGLERARVIEESMGIKIATPSEAAI